MEVSATDRDLGDDIRVRYTLEGTTAFQIDQNLGIISNLISFRESEGQDNYNFNAVASDGTNVGRAQVTVSMTVSLAAFSLD